MFSRTRLFTLLFAAGALSACGAPTTASGGDEAADSARTDIQCSTEARLVGLDDASATLIRYRFDPAASVPLSDDGAIDHLFVPGERVIADRAGNFYVIDASGELRLERLGLTGAPEAPVDLGGGFGNYRQVVTGGQGVLYALDDAGALHWFRHTDPESGTATWADGSGRVIADDFSGFQKLVSGGDGLLYALDSEGTVYWYLHLDADEGEADWASGSGSAIADGWHFKDLASSGDGTLYAVDDAGDVHLYHQEDPVGGAALFSPDSGRVVAHGFDRFTSLLAYTPPCDQTALEAALIHWGMYPAASDAYRTLGLSASRIVQTIGNAPASAGFHARDGYANGQPYCAATDISVSGLSQTFLRRLLDRMGRVGFAGWYRWPGHDGWPSYDMAHIHTVYAGAKMKWQLQDQVKDWLANRNGLASHTTYHFATFSSAAKAKVHSLFYGTPAPPASGGHCVAGGYYCGGDKVSGSASTLYRCNGSAAPTVIERCANGCAVNSGTDDVCRSPSACVVGGTYCGGDKVNGDPNALYRCTASYSRTLVRHCGNGCSVNSGRDDSCR